MHGAGHAPGQALGKVARLAGGQGVPALKRQRQAHDHGPHVLGLNKTQKSLEEAVARGALDALAGEGHAALGVGDGQAHAFGAEVDAEGAHGVAALCRAVPVVRGKQVRAAARVCVEGGGAVNGFAGGDCLGGELVTGVHGGKAAK